MTVPRACKWAWLWALLWACLPAPHFTCGSHAQCRAGDELGWCEAQGTCSFADPTCAPTFRRYARYDAGDGLANQCVPSPCVGDSIRTVRSGGGHACLVRTSGVVMCWGDNSEGQLGDGTFTGRSLPTTVAGLSAVTDVVDVALGAAHSCALRRSGAVVCWGRNGEGQLGDGTSIGRPVPASVPGAQGVALVAGGGTTCVVRADRKVDCWGGNDAGQLGAGVTSTTSPAVVSVAGVNDVQQLVLGDHHACALLGDRTVTCWGADDFGQLGDGASASRSAMAAVAGLQTVLELSAGQHHTCARRSDGAVLCWGRNDDGQLGAPGAGLVQANVPPAAVLRAGGRHTCTLVVDAAGAAQSWCWGANEAGQLGNGLTSVSSQPAPVLFERDTIDLAAGAGHTCALSLNGFLDCWGDDRAGQLGDGIALRNTRPTTVQATDGVVSLTSGRDHLCGRTQTGAAWCWGAGDHGQLGRATVDDGTTAMRVPGFSFAALVAGGGQTCGRTSLGQILCWGQGTDGQLGNGQMVDELSPTSVSVMAGTGSLALGAQHGCASTSGAVLCWGDNGFGQLGLGDGSQVSASAIPLPTLIGVTDPVVSLAAGEATTCALTAGSAVLCWGRGQNGELGDGQGHNASLAQAVAVPGSPPVAIALGRAHACAMVADGHVFCWGEGGQGQLGTGQPAVRALPAPVSGLADATALAAGDDHTCAVRNTGAVVCWGANSEGQLGDGTTSAAFVPVMIQGQARYRTVAAGAHHTCAVRTDGHVDCWGAAGRGQLGDGQPRLRATAAAVQLSCRE